jgi:glutamine synthetase
MNVEQARAFLKKHNVRYVLAQFVDVHGVAKTKSVPVHSFETIVKNGAGFAGFAIWGMGMEPHGPDFMAKGDLSTLMLMPWQPGYARIVCTGHVEGDPHSHDTRFILETQIKRLTARGWKLNTGLEPEFMLLKLDDDGSLVPSEGSDTLEKPCYDYKGLSRSRVFLERLNEALLPVGIDVYQIDHEDGNGQFEINYTYSDAMNSADQFTFVKMAAVEIANELGTICTFMPKPLTNRAGNGLHFHMSIEDENGDMVFFDDSDKRGCGLSKTAYQFLAGMLHHAPALTALCCPTVNSYKRLIAGKTLSGATWAPSYIAYGNNNRTVMARIPYGRIEMRLADSSANPYLAAAAMIAAGLDGIENDMDPGEPNDINFFAMDHDAISEMGVGLLPQSLHEAIQELEKDSLFSEQLGAPFIKDFIELKTMEWVDYHSHVSDYEVKRFLEFF